MKFVPVPVFCFELPVSCSFVFLSFSLLRLSRCDILSSPLHFSLLINMFILSDVRLMYKLIANL